MFSNLSQMLAIQHASAKCYIIFLSLPSTYTTLCSCLNYGYVRWTIPWSHYYWMS